MYILASHLDIQRIFPQPAAFTFVADSAAGKPIQEIFILDFVSVRLNPLEEFIDTDQGFIFSSSLDSIPYQIALFIRKVAIRLEYRNTIFSSHLHKMVLKPSHLFALPTGYRAVIYALCLVRNNQIFTHTDYLTESSAYRTGSKRAVETEHIFVRLAECHTISLKPVDKAFKILATGCRFALDIHSAVSFAETSRNGRM